MARPYLTALISKFVFRETLTSEEQGYLRVDIGAETSGAAATAQALAISTASAALTAHEADTVGAHAATAISNTPAGGIAATTVQAALNELDTETVKLAGVQTISGDKTFSGTLTVAGGFAASIQVESGASINFQTAGTLTFETGALVTYAGTAAADHRTALGLGTLATQNGTFSAAAILTLLGVPTYADITAANTALAIGKIYYDTALATLNVTTA